MNKSITINLNRDGDWTQAGRVTLDDLPATCAIGVGAEVTVSDHERPEHVNIHIDADYIPPGDESDYSGGFILGGEGGLWAKQIPVDSLPLRIGSLMVDKAGAGG